MAQKDHPATKFRHEIKALIAEVEACMPPVSKDCDREFNLQREAFDERRQQATALSGQLGIAQHSEWCMRSGDAHRIHEALKLSLTYFRGQLVT